MKFLVIFSLFFASTYGIFLECTFSDVTWSPGGSLYSCNVIQVTSVTQTICEGVRGTYGAGKTNNDVKGLIINNLVVSKIPERLSRYFAYLTSIELHNTNLMVISAADISQFGLLEHFFSFSNKIVTLEANLFATNPKLKSIYFVSNQIQSAGNNIFGNLNDLSVIDLRWNPCIHVLAKTSQEISQIRQNLPINCSPAVTTTLVPPTASTSRPGSCVRRCTLNTEFNALKTTSTRITTESNALKTRLTQQTAKIAELEARVKALVK